MLRSEALTDEIINLRVKQKEQAIGKDDKEMLVSNCKLHLTLKLWAKMLFSFFLAALSRSTCVYTASVPLCLVFPSVL